MNRNNINPMMNQFMANMMMYAKHLTLEQAERLQEQYKNKYKEIYNKDVKETIVPVDLIIAKHRKGATGKIDLLFELNKSSFKAYTSMDENAF